jgi:protein-export membrane protein SecD
MTRRNGLVFAIILVIFALTIWAVVPNSSLSKAAGREGMRLGLDLVGGVHLVYQGQFSDNTTSDEKSAAMDRAKLVIEKRIDSFGVTEPVIQTLGHDRVLIQLPGFTEIEAARSLVEQTGYLEFREVEKDATGELVYLSNYLSDNATDFYDASETEPRIFVNNDPGEGEEYGIFIATLSKVDGVLTFTDINGEVVDKATLQQYKDKKIASWIPARGDDGMPLTGDLLSDAQPDLGGSLGTEPMVDITWNDAGADIFDQIAMRLYNDTDTYSLDHVLGIFLDNNLISAPQIRAQAFYGEGVISGSFTTESAEELANLLKSGSLPVQLQKPPLYQEKVSATLGAEFVDMSWKAGLVGILLIMLFMIAYYRLPGFLASMSLVFYGTLAMAIYKLWPAPQITLTLAGLGGFIASIGMAVDANILIFERMKEEFRQGRTPAAAIEAGFNRAWSAIRDSNFTTFIACIILAIIGSNMAAGAAIKWFGITLLVGVAVSMFTAIVVTRTLLRLFVGRSLTDKPWLFTVGGGKK